METEVLDNKDLLISGEITVNCEASDNLTLLCTKFGSRFLGTEGERQAALFLGRKLREYALQNVHVEPCTMFGWKEGELTKLWGWRRSAACLELIRPVLQHLPCISLAYSPSTPRKGVEAELFNLESSSREYLLRNRNRIEGRIVLDAGSNTDVNQCETGVAGHLYGPTIYGYLAKFGAAGLIYANRNYGGLMKTAWTRFGFIGEVPACGISRETGESILRQMSKGSTVARLRLKNVYWPNAKSYNVFGDLPGSKYRERIVLVGGHYDSHDISMGAMDDGAGACVVLEVARALSTHHPSMKRTIRFCCFGSEETGLNGSSGYVLSHAEELANTELMINTDAAGISAKTGHGFVAWQQELASYLEKILSSLGRFDRAKELPRVLYSKELCDGRWPFFLLPYGDHWPFYATGIPTAHFRDIPQDPIDNIYSHTIADTLDKVDPKALKDAAIILALVLRRIADSEEISVKRSSVQNIAKSLEESELAENLRIEKRWMQHVGPPTVKSEDTDSPTS